MKKAMFLLGVLLVLGCNQTAPQGEKGSIGWVTNLSEAKTMAKEQGKPMFIDFHADWCSWCRRMDLDTYANKQVADMAKNFICVKIDTQEQSDVAENYRIRGLPSTVFLTAEAKIIETIPGYIPPEKFLEKLKQILDAQ